MNPSPSYTDLVNLTRLTRWDSRCRALDTAIAQHIMGWAEKDSSYEERQWEDPATGERHGTEAWSSNAEAILPLLTPYDWEADHAKDPGSYGRAHAYKVRAWINEVDDYVWGYGPSLAYAAAVFLLKARGVVVKD